MYFVDREKIEQTLLYMEKQLEFIGKNRSFQTELEQLAFERSTHVLIEVILDIGNTMIDGFIMRDPGSYEDIIDILDDEKVITKDMIEPLKEVVGARKSLVQQYIEVDHDKIFTLFLNALPSLKQFPFSIRKYLTNELGPVSAFKN
ncbi:type VII toxin-antitoxin system HepT family RNase toxin [Jeotgalibacillus marinus]|uniref:DUF86 domain-containing protein n=1 Tax=Jeotgalibacillus marinus TaxID=86667 RepID=A0ABV3Q3P8_9BACL